MIKRKIYNSLEKHLQEIEMTILVGPRQVGKTYLMTELERDLKAKGEKTIFLNLDIEDQKQLFISQSRLIAYINLQTGGKKAYVFIDEIQRKENAELFLKGIADMKLPYKFIISGSGSLELKAKIKESMAGRKKIFTINPVSFDEFVNFKTDYRYEDRLLDFFNIDNSQTLRLLEEYLIFGGYPRVVLANSREKKNSEMEEIYQSYADRDLRELLGIEKTEAFANLLKILASQIGNLVNSAELSRTVGIADQTIKRYLYFLEKTFIIKKITPYYKNIRSEITKAPIYYFYDLGLRNWLLGLFGLPQIPPLLSGHLFENLVFNLLQSEVLPPTMIHFWRTKDDAEVDFVLVKGLNTLPIEAKYSNIQKPEITRSFKSYLKRYHAQNGYFVHLGEKKTRRFEKTTVNFIPFYQILSEGIEKRVT